MVLKVAVAPCGGHKGSKVVLDKRSSGKLVKVSRKAIDDDCKARFARRQSKKTKYRAPWPKQHADHEAGTSAARTVRIG